jgi:hypothetical protein
MKHLRVSFIQDSVLLRLAYPNHPVWKAPLFSTPEYQLFATNALAKLQVPEPESLVTSIRQAMPIMSNVVDAGLKTIDRCLTALESGVCDIRVDLGKIVRGGVRLVFDGRDEEKSSEPSKKRSEDGATVYVLSRALQSVVEVWDEYAVGLGDGPSVRGFEATQGAKWRATDAERKYFSRRKVFYDAIHYLATTCGIPASTVAHHLENIRKSRKLTLDSMMRQLKASGAAAVFDDKG